MIVFIYIYQENSSDLVAKFTRINISKYSRQILSCDMRWERYWAIPWYFDKFCRALVLDFFEKNHT